MHLKTYIVFNHWILFYISYNFVIIKGLIGVNVRKANEGEFSYIASFMYRIPQRRIRQNTFHICTAVLITNRHILTASHCFEDESPNKTQIVVGSISLKTGRIYYPMWFISFNEWSNHKQLSIQFRINDMGVSKLTENVHNSIVPAAISTWSNHQLYGKHGSVAGWGVIENNRYPIIMRTVDLRILSIEECESKIEEAHGSKITIHNRHLCTIGEPYALLQFGDSGGPLIFNNTVIGINKATIPFPEQYNNPKKVNIQSGIEFYKPFIMDVIHRDFVWS